MYDPFAPENTPFWRFQDMSEGLEPSSTARQPRKAFQYAKPMHERLAASRIHMRDSVDRGPKGLAMDKCKNDRPSLSAAPSIGSKGWIQVDEPNSGIAHYRGASSPRRAQGGAPNRREDPQVGIVGDILIRAIGLLGIGLAVVAGTWLHHDLRGADAANPTLGEYALATLMFVAASLGAGLLILGRHIHDRIEVAERWRRRW